jgi:cytochrome c oxidase cbb3-type subunit 3
MDNRKNSLLLLLLTVLSLQACQTIDNRSVDISVDGAELFTAHCAACHGVRGRGGVGVPLALNDFLKHSSDEFLAMTIRVGRPGRVMPSFWYLTEREIQAIVATIRHWGPQSPPYIDKPIAGDPVKGKRLFNEHCAHCHGKDAVGGAGAGAAFSRERHMMIIPPALNNAGFLLSSTDEMIKRTITFGRVGTPMKSFRRKGLKRGDVNNLVAYIRAFQSELPPSLSVVTEAISAIISVESPYSMDETIKRIKEVLAHNKWVMEGVIDRKMGDINQSNLKVRELYFSHLTTTRDALKIDPRLGLFLPARITLTQRDGAPVVMVMANPSQFSTLFNNSELNKMGLQMASQYQSILNEVVQ